MKARKAVINLGNAYYNNLTGFLYKFFIKVKLSLGGNKMSKAYFCSTCKKIFNEGNPCNCQEEGCVKELKLGTPVNVTGTKLKGKVYRIKKDEVEVLITSSKNRSIKAYRLEQIRKVL